MGNLSNLYISQSYQSLIHLGSDNTASTTLVGLQDGLGNSIGVSVNTGGDLSISGSFTSSLQQGYVWVGNASGKTKTVPTSSFGGTINTGSFATTGSNTFIGAQTIKSNNGTPLILDHSDSTPTQNTLLAFFKSGSAEWSIGNLGTDDSFILYNPTTFQTPISVAQNNSVTLLGNLTASLQQGYAWVGGVGNVSKLVPTSSFGSTINTGSFATTGSNTFNGNQTINGYINVAGGIGVSGSQTIGTSTGSINLNVGTGSINLTVGRSSQSIIFLNSYLTQNVGRFSVAGDEFNVKTQDDTSLKLSLDTTQGEYVPMNLYGQYAYDTVNVHSGNSGSAPYAGHTIDDADTSGNNIGFFGTYIDGATQATYGVIFVGGGQTNNAANDGIIFRSYGNFNSVDFLKNVAVTGSLSTTGNITMGGSKVVTSSQTGSFLTTSSFNTYTSSVDAKFATIGTQSGSWGGGGSAFPYTGSAAITGSLSVTGSMAGKVNALVVTSTTASLDFSIGNMFTLTLPSASTTYFNPANIKAGQTINVQLTQQTPGTGSVSFAPSIKFAGGNDYQATATGSAVDLITFISLDGTNVLATSIKNFL